MAVDGAGGVESVRDALFDVVEVGLAGRVDAGAFGLDVAGGGEDALAGCGGERG